MNHPIHWAAAGSPVWEYRARFSRMGKGRGAVCQPWRLLTQPCLGEEPKEDFSCLHPESVESCPPPQLWVPALISARFSGLQGHRGAQPLCRLGSW